MKLNNKKDSASGMLVLFEAGFQLTTLPSSQRSLFPPPFRAHTGMNDRSQEDFI